MKAKLSAIPSKTMADTKYCVNVWQQWCAHISIEYGEEVTPLKEISTQELSTKLCLFVFKVRNKTERNFLQIHFFILWLAYNDTSGLKGDRPLTFLRTVSSQNFECAWTEMKRLRNSGLGSKTKKAQPLSIEEEEILWQRGLLGKSNPQALFDTMVVMNGLYFALRSGKEHRQALQQSKQFRSVFCSFPVIQ